MDCKDASPHIATLVEVWKRGEDPILYGLEAVEDHWGMCPNCQDVVAGMLAVMDIPLPFGDGATLREQITGRPGEALIQRLRRWMKMKW